MIEDTRDFQRRVFKTIEKHFPGGSLQPGIPIIYYNPKSHGAEDYSELAQEVISFEKKKLYAAY